MGKLFFVLIYVFLLSAETFANGIVIDKIVATVEGMPITSYEVKNIAGFYKGSKDVLKSIVNDYVIMYYAKRLGITVTDEDVDRFIRNVAERNGLTVDEFLKRLRESGIDEHYYRLGVKLQLYRRKFAMRMFAYGVSISKADIERYYKLHKDELKVAPVLVMSIIAVKNRALAEKIYNELTSGADFYKLKARYSMDKQPERAIPLSAFNSAIRSQLASLKPGQISSIIESNGVYYIVKLIKRQGGATGLKNVEERIRNLLFAKKIDARLKSWLKMVKARTDIEIFE